jgi:hypothetical protein
MAINVVKEKYNELITFFQEWIPATVPGVNLYLIGQGSPRPENPYVAFRPITSVETVGLYDERRIDDNGIETLRGQRYITCDLFAYSDAPTRFDGTDDAWSILQELRFSFCYPLTMELLRNITCRVLDEGQVIDLSETLNTTNEPRAQLQFRLSTVIEQTVDNGEIKTVNAQGTIEGSNNPVTVDVSVTKP